MSYIQFDNVVKRFGENTVLDHITVDIKKGDLVTLLGPSGCGKSTLLRCLSGLESVSEGKIFIDGEDITDVPASKRGVGMVFQQYSLFPNMTVAQNIAFGLKMQKKPQDVIDQQVKKAVELVELEGKEKEYPSNLSGGQQQRVALARSIVTEPKVLLLDEPLSAIDAKLRKALQIRIREIHKELGLTTIFVTHDQDEAMVLSDVIQLFHAGKIEQSGSPVSVYTRPVSTFAASFIGSYNQICIKDFEAVTGRKSDYILQKAAKSQAESENTKSKKKDKTEKSGIVSDQQASTIVIRPETISISKEKPAEDGCYVIHGKITGNTPRGNVLRYDVMAENVKIHVDVLFRSFHLYEDGEEIWLSVPEHDCLPLQAACAVN